MGEAVLVATLLAKSLGLLKPKPVEKPTETPALPQLVSEEVRTYAQRQARRRRGMGSTLLTGDLDVSPSVVGKKELLGS